MDLIPEWTEFSDLTVLEGAYLLLGIDPKRHFFMTEHDDEYGAYCYERGWDEDAIQKTEPLLSAIRAKSISTTTDHLTPDGETDTSRTRMLKTTFIDWCRTHGYAELADDLAGADPTQERVNDSSGVENRWIARAIDLANKIGQERWEQGHRQITARNISETVAAELQNDPSSFGKRGPRSANNIRTEALKGWHFSPTPNLGGLNGSNPD